MPNTDASEATRKTRERLARCISTMVFYQADGWSWTAAQLLFEEVKALKDWASWHVPGDELGPAILDPLGAELTLRYGKSTGDKLHREFLRAYEGAVKGGSADQEPAYARHFRTRSH